MAEARALAVTVQQRRETSPATHTSFRQVGAKSDISWRTRATRLVTHWDLPTPFSVPFILDDPRFPVKPRFIFPTWMGSEVGVEHEL
jgi:hypothetical protein